MTSLCAESVHHHPPGHNELVYSLSLFVMLARFFNFIKLRTAFYNGRHCVCGVNSKSPQWKFLHWNWFFGFCLVRRRSGGYCAEGESRNLGIRTLHWTVLRFSFFLPLLKASVIFIGHTIEATKQVVGGLIHFNSFRKASSILPFRRKKFHLFFATLSDRADSLGSALSLREGAGKIEESLWNTNK